MPEILDDFKDKEKKKSNIKKPILWLLLMTGNGLLLGLTMHESTPIFYYFLYGLMSPLITMSILGFFLFIIDSLLFLLTIKTTGSIFLDFTFKKALIDTMFSYSTISFFILLILYLLGFNFGFELNTL